MNNTFVAVKSACESLGYDVRSYSGRGMYGRSCLGIETDRYTSAATVAFRLAVQLVEDGEQDAAEDVAGMEWSEDSLGLGRSMPTAQARPSFETSSLPARTR